MQHNSVFQSLNIMSHRFLGLTIPGPDRFLQAVDRLGERLSINVPAVFNPQDLAQLPTGTLGWALVDHFTQNGFAPLTTGPRRKQLHDAVHVLTGYHTDPIGELEVQAFLLGAKFFPTHIFLGAALLHLADRQPNLRRGAMLRRLRQAYARGRRSAIDIDQWQPEQQWHLPLIQVQQMFNLDPDR
jgi:ubiquinone biosynthesis protein COQ4